MKFRFSFEKLLAHKRTLEDIARREYAEAQARVDAAEAELKRMYGQIDDSRKRALDLGLKGGTQGPALSQIDEFIRGQGVRIERHKLKIRELKTVAEEKQEALIAAAKERKIYEKLREKRLEEFKLLQKKHELKQVDDLVVTRFRQPEDESGNA